MKRTIKAYIWLAALLLTAAAVVSPAAAAAGGSSGNTLIVKIGYSDMPGLLYTDSSGALAGIAYELFSELSFYTDIECEYVPVAYKDIDAGFESGEIDVFIPFRQTEKRLEQYSYSRKPFCYSRTSLFCAADKEIFYGDFENFEGLTVGSEKGSCNREIYEKLFAENGCTVTFIERFATTAELRKALEDGKIDAFICSSEQSIDGCKAVYSMDRLPAYVIAPKDKTKYLDIFDEAMLSLEINTPIFTEELEDKYRVSPEGSGLSLTREEADYIENRGSVSVITSEADTEDGNFTGGLRQMLDLITEKTGLLFHPVIRGTREQMLSSLTQGEGEMEFSFDRDYDWAKEHNAWLTKSYITFNAVIAKYPSVNQEDIKTVGVVRGSFIENYMKHSGEWTVIGYDYYSDALDAVKSKDIDAAVSGAPVSSYYSADPEYSRLAFSAKYDFSSRYCIAVSKASDKILADIINKVIGSISQAQMADLFQQNYTHTAGIMEYFYSNPAIGIAIIIAVCAAAVLFMLFLLSLRADKKKVKAQAEATTAKMEFLSRISHDIRTPLSGIISITRSAKETTDENERQESFEKIEDSGKFLLSLVNDFLEFTRDNKLHDLLNPEPYPLDELKKFIGGVIRPMSESKDIDLIINEAKELDDIPVTDRLKLNQILINLMANAVKYTQPGGRVELDCSTRRKKNKLEMEFRVIDNGIGMSEEFQEHMFEPFAQENQLGDSRTQGTGLGLSITAGLVKKLDGTITAESAKGKGTCFTVILPAGYIERAVYKQQCSIPTAPENEKGESLEGCRVLVCEDHPLNAEIMVRLLKSLGATADVAVNGQEGLDKFSDSEEGCYDAVLMDIRMPLLDGISASKQIRRMSRADASTVPIIAMTANVYDSDEQLSLTAGMNAHLTKPIDPKKLAKTLYKLINSNR